MIFALALVATLVLLSFAPAVGVHVAEAGGYGGGGYDGGDNANPNKGDGGTPYCAGRTLPKDAYLITMALDSFIFWEPDIRSQIGTLKVKAEQTFWTFPTLNDEANKDKDEEDHFMSILIACEIVWVPKGTVVPVA